MCLSQARNMCSFLRRCEVVVPFVDIGGIIDHHCLNFLFTWVNIHGIIDLTVFSILSRAKLYA